VRDKASYFFAALAVDCKDRFTKTAYDLFFFSCLSHGFNVAQVLKASTTSLLGQCMVNERAHRYNANDQLVGRIFFDEILPQCKPLASLTLPHGQLSPSIDSMSDNSALSSLLESAEAMATLQLYIRISREILSHQQISNLKPDSDSRRSERHHLAVVTVKLLLLHCVLKGSIERRESLQLDYAAVGTNGAIADVADNLERFFQLACSHFTSLDEEEKKSFSSDTDFFDGRVFFLLLQYHNLVALDPVHDATVIAALEYVWSLVLAPQKIDLEGEKEVVVVDECQIESRSSFFPIWENDCISRYQLQTLENSNHSNVDAEKPSQYAKLTKISSPFVAKVLSGVKLSHCDELEVEKEDILHGLPHQELFHYHTFQLLDDHVYTETSAKLRKDFTIELELSRHEQGMPRSWRTGIKLDDECSFL
jgi:hypothetical protein